MDIVKIKKVLPNILLIVIGLIVVFTILRNKKNNELLQGKTISTIAVITKITSGTAVKSIAGVDYYYNVNSEKYYYSDNGDFNFMKVGDTILIEYAEKNPSVSRVVSKYYMQKYKHLKK